MPPIPSQYKKLLERHPCTLSTNNKKKYGDLLITSNNFCFDTFPLVTTTDIVSLKLRDIAVLKKVKVNLVFDAICIVMQDGSKYTFYGFHNREQAYKDLYDQTLFIGQ